MTNKAIKIWFWVQNNRILKAVSNLEAGTLTIYDDYDNIILRRTGLTRLQIKAIEYILSTYRFKRLDDHQEPFNYL